MRVLGINDGHNASACLLEDGSIKFCIQEERVTNDKNYFGFPFRSIKTILNLANLRASDIDFVAMASFQTVQLFNPDDSAGYYKKQLSFRGKINRVLTKTPLYSIHKTRWVTTQPPR